MIIQIGAPWRTSKGVPYNGLVSGTSSVNSLRIALGSDERSHLTDYLVRELRERGFQVDLFGSLRDDAPPGAYPWPDVAREVAERVSTGQADEGVLLCWTGTGVCMAANKVPGVRAALCWDAETARGARAWNRANVLCLSLRATSQAVAREILDAWFSASPDPSEEPNIQKLQQMDDRYRRQFSAAAPVQGEKGRV